MRITPKPGTHDAQQNDTNELEKGRVSLIEYRDNKQGVRSLISLKDKWEITKKLIDFLGYKLCSQSETSIFLPTRALIAGSDTAKCGEHSQSGTK